MNGVRSAFEGRVAQDPELTYTQAGQALLSFSVAVDEREGGGGAPRPSGAR